MEIGERKVEFKTKSHVFTLISADIQEKAISVTFIQNGETQEELLDIFKTPEETATLYTDEKELSGYTEFVSLQMQKSTGIKKEDDKKEDLLAIVRLKKPDLTADKLKAAITYLGIMNENPEVAEVLNE